MRERSKEPKFSSGDTDENDITKILQIFYLLSGLVFIFCFFDIFNDHGERRIATIENTNTLKLEEHIRIKYNYFLGFSTEIDKINLEISVPYYMFEDVKPLKIGYYCVKYKKNYYDTNKIKYELIELSHGECKKQTKTMIM